MKNRRDEAQRLLEEYLDHVEHHRSPGSSFAARGVVVLDVLRYRLHVPRQPPNGRKEPRRSAAL
ncbi:MAG: hypothetical protein ACRDKG_15400 [Actinomycetota bacterium]